MDLASSVRGEGEVRSHRPLGLALLAAPQHPRVARPRVIRSKGGGRPLHSPISQMGCRLDYAYESRRSGT
eukprot:scaffold100842_cov72-Phaeocystis_antarctica.AAC.7